MQICVNGAIIGQKKIDRNDRLITILTEKNGVLTAYIKDSRSLKQSASKSFSASCEMLSYGEFTLFKNKERYTVDGFDRHSAFFEMRGDLEKLALALYFSELCCELATQWDDTTETLRLFLNCLHMLIKNKKNIAELKPTFELRLLTQAGYMPNIVACQSCGAFESAAMFFSAAKGELYCDACFDDKLNPAAVKLPQAVVGAMRHIIFSEPGLLFNFSISDKALEILQAVSEYYLIVQTERSYTALEYFKKIYLR